MSSLAEVAKAGDRTKTLEALRDYLASALDQCDSDRDRAALTARFIDCVNQLDGVPTEHKETTAERITREAEERLAAAREENGGT